MAKISFSKCLKAGSLVGLSMLAVACTSGSSGLKSNSAEKQVAIQQPLATGAPEIARITAKGGTKIAILVNDRPITSNDIKRRAAFVKLRRMKGNSRKIASDELVNEAIKMQEARRIRAVASQKDVDAAYVRFAKSNKMPPKILTKILNKRGVTKRGFKDYIRAQISWQRTVSARLQAEASGRGGPKTAPSTQAWLSSKDAGSTKEKEFTIQQVVFIVPKAKRASQLNKRRAQAKNFRNRMRGCSNARTLASGLRDVTVLDRGRILQSGLPPLWKKELLTLGVGKVTRVKDTQRGLEMLAVCKKREVIGSATAKANGDLFAGKNFQKAASALDKKYLAELTKRAVIKRR
ncbi:MAG: peptidylprolyl isomerase [Rhizobiaceae bacterium]